MRGYPSTELVQGSWLDYLLLHGQGRTLSHMLVMLMLLQYHVALGVLLATRVV
jgi:hypothetical protein